MTVREMAVAVPLLAFAVLLGVFPQYFVFDYMAPTVEQKVENLADWAQRHRAEIVVAEGEAEDVAPAPAVDVTADSRTDQVAAMHVASERSLPRGQSETAPPGAAGSAELPTFRRAPAPIPHIQ